MPLELTSPAFDDGDEIPRKYGYTEENVNPPLEFDEVPRDAEALALIVDDPDAREPAGKIWDHWVVWNLPVDVAEIPEDWSPADAVEGENDYGERGYGGPNPPDGEHTYRFQLHALEEELDVPLSTSADDLRDAMNRIVIEADELTGTYAP